MIVSSLLLFTFVLTLLGKYYFKYWLNPLSLYGGIWFFMLFSYSLKILNYNDLTLSTAIFIFLNLFSYFIGILTIIFAYKLNNVEINLESASQKIYIYLSSNESTIKYFALGFGIVGLIGAIHGWTVLLAIYGSIPEVLINLAAIYKMRIGGEIEGFIPYIGTFSYISIFFAGIYSAFKGRFTLISIIPLLAIILKGIALVGRANILLGFVEFFFVIIFTRYLIGKLPQSYKFASSLKLKISAIAVLFLFLFSITLIKDFRGNIETFRGETVQSRKLKDNPVLQPSIYLYTSGHIAVLNKYLEKGEESFRFGENSFQFVYNFLSKFDLVEKPRGYQKGYYVPMWINTGTYLRELHADFGFFGVYFVNYLMGLMLAFSWRKLFTEMNIKYILPLVFLSIIIFFSFLMVITRLAIFPMSFIIIFVLQEYLYRKSNSIPTKSGNK